MFLVLTFDLIESNVVPFDFLALLLACVYLFYELDDFGRLTCETLSLL